MLVVDIYVIQKNICTTIKLQGLNFLLKDGCVYIEKLHPSTITDVVTLITIKLS